MTEHASAATLRGAGGYLARRFPPHTQGVAVLACYLCCTWLYAIAATGKIAIPLAAVAGAATTVLLFLQLRLVDDLNDLPHDVPPERRAAARSRLAAGLAATVIVIAALNIAWPPALVTAAAATVLTLATPLVLKRVLRENRPLLAPCYEGGPALSLLYGYVLWSSGTGLRVSAAVVAGAVGGFWAGYEFWKFSRKAGQPAYQPYGLSYRGVRAVLIGLLAAAMAADLLLVRFGALSVVFAGYALVAPAGFAILVLRRWPAAGTRPGWVGLPFVATMVVAVLVEVAIAGVR